MKIFFFGMEEGPRGLPLHPGNRIPLESLSSVALSSIRLFEVYAEGCLTAPFG